MRPITSTLASLALLALACVSARAQSTTNITIVVRVVDASGTNNYTLNASASHVLGANVAYNSWVAADPVNNTNSFSLFVKQTITDKIAPLSDLGNQYTVQGSHLYSLGQQLPLLMQQMTQADQAALVALYRKYVP